MSAGDAVVEKLRLFLKEQALSLGCVLSWQTDERGGPWLVLLDGERGITVLFGEVAQCLLGRAQRENNLVVVYGAGDGALVGSARPGLDFVGVMPTLTPLTLHDLLEDLTETLCEMRSLQAQFDQAAASLDDEFSKWLTVENAAPTNVHSLTRKRADLDDAAMAAGGFELEIDLDGGDDDGDDDDEGA